MLKNLLKVFLIVIVVLVALEFATRIFIHDSNKEPVVPHSVGRFDPELGWLCKPGSKGVSSRTGYPIEYRINSKGLRDDETTYEKPDSVFRIVLLGDSETFGFGVPIEKHFSKLLEGYFRNVEVINLGINGFGIDQELIYLRKEGFKYQPDLVLAYIGHFGAHRHMYTKRFGEEKPMFKLENGKLILTNTPVKDIRVAINTPILKDIHEWLTGHSVVYQILRNFAIGMYSSHAAQKQAQSDRRNSKDSTFSKKELELGEAIIFAMNDESKQHEAKFILMTKSYNLPKLKEDAVKNNIYTLDIARATFNKKLNIIDVGHHNESGNGIIAWEIAKFLMDNNLIPQRYLFRKK